MKKIITLALSLIAIISLSAQAFEGKIAYTNSYKSKNLQMSDRQWDAMMGTSLEYQIKGGDYRISSNGSFFKWQLYINKENKLYNKTGGTEAVLWNDASVQGDVILKSEVNKSEVTILGYKCDEVILTCKSGVQRYYFNSKFSVDPKLFVNHKFGNFYDYLVKANALPLKTIIETDQFIMESTATEIKPMKLDAATFQLPAGIKTEKNPY